NKNNKGFYETTFGEENNLHLMVYLPGKSVWIDKYEVSNLRFKRYLKKLNISSPTSGQSKFYNSGDSYPVVVQHREAAGYSKAFRFRLPRVDEWEYAAGKGVFNYPWGNELPDEGGVWRANYDTLEENGDKDGFSGTAPVNSFREFASPFGIVNMAGKVWEWVQGGIAKGGGFLSAAEDLIITKRGGGRDKDKVGFRCVKEESPGN
ncbi:MAG: formylglycine-generating enzyme family protein, partial [bacterium]|nr:formylglycine-generating enzyme family protein [bacterium]